ncbi:MAG: hypothetical protein AAGM67_17570 [Bacteroidota bacterium]
MMCVISLVSCRPEGVNPTKCRGGECTYTFRDGRQINIIEDSIEQDTFIEIGLGDRRVFHYDYLADDDPRIADDEYSENIYFEVDPDADSFLFIDAALADAMLVIQPICFCPPEVFQPLRGTLSGQKRNDDQWEIELDVEYESYGEIVQRSFSARFARE